MSHRPVTDPLRTILTEAQDRLGRVRVQMRRKHKTTVYEGFSEEFGVFGATLNLQAFEDMGYPERIMVDIEAVE